MKFTKKYNCVLANITLLLSIPLSFGLALYLDGIYIPSPNHDISWLPYISFETTMYGLPFFLVSILLLLLSICTYKIYFRKLCKFLKYSIGIVSISLISSLFYTTILIRNGYRLIASIEGFFANISTFLYIYMLFVICFTAYQVTNHSKKLEITKSKLQPKELYSFTLITLPIILMFLSAPFILLLVGFSTAIEKEEQNSIVVRIEDSYSYGALHLEIYPDTNYKKINPILLKKMDISTNYK